MRKEASNTVDTIIKLYRHNLKTKEIAETIGCSQAYASSILTIVKHVINGNARSLDSYKPNDVANVCRALGMERPTVKALEQELEQVEEPTQEVKDYTERLDELDAKLGDITRVLCDMHECLRRMLEVWKNG